MGEFGFSVGIPARWGDALYCVGGEAVHGADGTGGAGAKTGGGGAGGPAGHGPCATGNTRGVVSSLAVAVVLILSLVNLNMISSILIVYRKPIILFDSLTDIIP